MKTQFAAVAAFAGAAYASLEGYEAATTSAPVAPSYGAETSAPASTTTYACNPAHEYPEGIVCTTVSGSLTLVTPTSSTTSCSEEIETTTVPAYPVTTSVSSVTVPAYPTTSSWVQSTTEWTSAPTWSTSSVPDVPVYSASTSVPAPVWSTSTVPEAPGYSKSSSSPVWSATESTSVTVPAYPVTTSEADCDCTHEVATSTGWLTATYPSGTPIKPYGYSNTTVPASGTGSVPSSTSPIAYTGAASKMAGGAFLGLAGVIGAFFL